MIYKIMLWNALKNKHFGKQSIASTYRKDAIRISLGDKKYFQLIDKDTYQIKQTILGSDEKEEIIVFS